MTIAACCVSPEGVVLGADSAATFGSRTHFFHEQKVFELGQQGASRLGITFWGLGSMGDLSYRTLIAMFNDEVIGQPAWTVREAAVRWRDLFLGAYNSEYHADIDRVQSLLAQAIRNEEEEEELDDLVSRRSGGFCIGGHASSDKLPKAFSITYSPRQGQPEEPEEIEIGRPQFWGQPNMLRRLSLGIDINTFSAILGAKDSAGDPLWKGSEGDLIQIVSDNILGRPSKHLPVREAIDWVYSSIYTTIKAMKFANLPPVCGGPIEVAVITSDRPFRWVRHKELDTAIGRHPTRDA